MSDPRAAKGPNDLRLPVGVRAAIALMAISGRFTFLGKAHAEANIPHAVLSTLGGLIWAIAHPTFKKLREVVGGTLQ